MKRSLFFILTSFLLIAGISVYAHGGHGGHHGGGHHRSHHAGRHHRGHYGHHGYYGRGWGYGGYGYGGWGYPVGVATGVTGAALVRDAYTNDPVQYVQEVPIDQDYEDDQNFYE